MECTLLLPLLLRKACFEMVLNELLRGIRKNDKGPLATFREADIPFRYPLFGLFHE